MEGNFWGDLVWCLLDCLGKNWRVWIWKVVFCCFFCFGGLYFWHGWLWVFGECLGEDMFRLGDVVGLFCTCCIVFSGVLDRWFFDVVLECLWPYEKFLRDCYLDVF